MSVDDIRKQLGLVHLYTGNGKGKTTAALGLAMRALEHGLKVHVIQFLKGGTYTGELLAPKRFGDDFVIEQFGKGSEDEPRFSDFEPDDEDRSRALAALRRAREVLAQTDVLILDEANVAVNLGHLKKEELISLIDSKPENTELVITGRYAPKELYEYSDYVTEMKANKHPFDRGILGRTGIDF